MDGYKKIFKNQGSRMKILKLLSFVPDSIMIPFQYFIKLKRWPNLKNPQRYTEKLQWYKMHYREPIMTQCVDKYSVRKYIEQKGLGNILVKNYGVFDSPEAIDFTLLPEKFIIKTTNGSGTNIICNNKKQLVKSDVVEKLNEYMSRPQISAGREWAYNDVKNRIIVDELLEDDTNPYGGINDYKFICFSGKVFCVVVDVGRFSEHRRNFYTPEWKRIQAISDHENFEPDIAPPKQLEYMLQVAERLSASFPHVRVDLYSVKEQIYFGELTFYPWSGYVQYTPDRFDFELGERFVLERCHSESSSKPKD